MKGKGYSGYRNMGNTCYFNAALCAIGNCLELTDYFISEDFKKDIGPKNFERTAEFSFLMIYTKTLESFYESNKIIIPKSLYGKFLGLSRFSRNKQGDAYICIVSILDILNSGLYRSITYTPPDKTLHKYTVESKEVFYNHFKTTYSKMTDLFFGQYIQKVTCCICSCSSYSYQPFMGINLNIDDKEIQTIYNILHSYFKNQTLEKTCNENCKRSTLHVIKTRIIKLPKYLIIHFKRFDNSNKKLNNTIAFASDLDMVDYTHRTNSEPTGYELISVINHIGNTNGGHYTTMNRTFDGNWISINDEQITNTLPTDVCSKYAYILFYERH
jgi:ubiquitin carboxyl-terminal hydrolase 8